jgi:type I restriction enzyme M protein
VGTGRSGNSISLGEKGSHDIFSLRDERLQDSDSLPAPDVLAQEIIQDVEAAFEQFREVS